MLLFNSVGGEAIGKLLSTTSSRDTATLSVSRTTCTYHGDQVEKSPRDSFLPSIIFVL